MKRVKLGLGGKSPSVVLQYADFKRAIPSALDTARRLEEATSLIRERLAEIRVGDPDESKTQIGPMARRARFDQVQYCIQAGINADAGVLVGGTGKPDGPDLGYYVRPTVFTGVRNDMKIAQEEIFGPVLPVIAYDDEEHAIAIANDSIFGLHAYFFSSDEQHARNVAGRLKAGRVAIGGFKHEPHAPFGGYKQSGIGRECGVACDAGLTGAIRGTASPRSPR